MKIAKLVIVLSAAVIMASGLACVLVSAIMIGAESNVSTEQKQIKKVYDEKVRVANWEFENDDASVKGAYALAVAEANEEYEDMVLDHARSLEDLKNTLDADLADLKFAYDTDVAEVDANDLLDAAGKAAAKVVLKEAYDKAVTKTNDDYAIDLAELRHDNAQELAEAKVELARALEDAKIDYDRDLEDAERDHKEALRVLKYQYELALLDLKAAGYAEIDGDIFMTTSKKERTKNAIVERKVTSTVETYSTDLDVILNTVTTEKTKLTPMGAVLVVGMIFFFAGAAVIVTMHFARGCCTGETKASAKK